MDNIKRIWARMKGWQKAVTIVFGLALLNGLVPKQKPAPATAVATPAPAAPAATPVPSTPEPAAPPQDTMTVIGADRKDKVLADARKVATLDVQVETLTLQAKEGFVTYYGQNDKKGYSLVEPLFNDAMHAMDQIDGSVQVNLANEVKPYLDAVAVEATARVNLISLYMDALSGSRNAAQDALKSNPELTSAMSKTSDERQALAKRLGVTEDVLTGR